MNGTKLEKIEKAEDPDEFHELDEKILLSLVSFIRLLLRALIVEK